MARDRNTVRTARWLALLMLLVAGLLQVTAVPARAQEPPRAQSVPNRFIVMLKDGPAAQTTRTVFTFNALSGVKVTHTYTSVFQGFAAEITRSG